MEEHEKLDKYWSLRMKCVTTLLHKTMILGIKRMTKIDTFLKKADAARGWGQEQATKSEEQY